VNEFVGLDLAEGRPQRMSVPTPMNVRSSRLEIDRLVHHAELVVFQGPPEIEFELVAALDIRTHLGPECLGAVLSRGLGLVQRHIGITEKVPRYLAIPDGDTDTGGDDDRRGRRLDLEQRLRQPLGDSAQELVRGRMTQGVAGVLELVQVDGECRPRRATLSYHTERSYHHYLCNWDVSVRGGR